jgi:hypothetical protein
LAAGRGARPPRAAELGLHGSLAFGGAARGLRAFAGLAGRRLAHLRFVRLGWFRPVDDQDLADMLHRGCIGPGADFVKNGGAVVPLRLCPDLDQAVGGQRKVDFGQYRAAQAFVADQHHGDEFMGERLQ